MAKKPTVLSDEEVLTKVLQKSKTSVAWYDSRLSKERERVLDYYNGKLPKRQHAGASSYVSTDVYDSVEMMKSQLLETFAGGEEIAQFDPDQDMNADLCRVATQYASYVIFRENDGFGVFNDVIHDGLTARVGVAKVSWEECFVYSEETFENLSHDDAMATASQEDVDEFDGTQNEDGTFSGTLTRKTDKSKVAIDVVAPEEFLITARAVSIKRADYTGHRTLKTRADLIDMGYDKKKIAEIGYDDAKGLDMSPEVLARNSAVDSGTGIHDEISKELEQVMFYESFVKMQIDSSKGVRLYKICHAGSVLLDKEEVEKAPFFPYTPLPVPHIFYGNNFAARVIPSQNARTVLTRAVLDHSAMTTNPRWLVANGGLLNPRELLENRLGGIVNARRPDSVAPLPQSSLNPYVFQVLGMLKDDKEQSTGISSLAQGMNKDAISTQNSKGLVDQMVSLSGQREKIAARNFALKFFVPLMIEVIRLAIINEKKEKVIEVAGQPLAVDPRQWTERTACKISMHLGYGEKDQAVQKHVAAYEQLSKDPMLQNAFGLKQRTALIHDTFKLAGLANAANYLDMNAQPPAPDPMKEREIAAKEKLASAAMIQAQSAVAKDERLSAVDATKMQLEQAEATAKAVHMDRDGDRHDRETDSRINIANREMTLEESMPDSSRKAIVNP